MTVQDFVGDWTLSGTAHVTGQLEFVGDTTTPGAHDAWLRGTGATELAAVEPASGLTLTVHHDATFTETGESAVTLFDPDGVEIGGDVPYPGRLVATSNGVCVFTDTSTIPAAVIDVPDPSILRVSDDVNIAERFEIIAGRLVRTTNVVTDGIYTARVVLVYDRSTSERAPTQTAAESAASPVEADPEVLRLQEEIVVGVLDAAPVSWERIIVRVQALHMGAQPKQQSYLTFCVHRDEGGVHSLVQFHIDALDTLFIALRERINEVHGKRWGTCVLRIEPPREVDFQVDFEPSPMAKGEPSGDRYHERHLPFFLEERGLEA